MPTAHTPRRPVLDLHRAVPRPIRRDCQKCGGTRTGHSVGADFVCLAGHVTEPLSTGPIRTYA
jgi:hypothetical protein